MKILTTDQIREADSATIRSQGITSLQLMERAANEVFLWLKKEFPDKETVFHVFCGKGNNGGDGLVVARLLAKDGYEVLLNIVGNGMPSADFTASLDKIQDEKLEFDQTGEISSFGRGRAVVIDALLGIGLTREPEGEYAAAIEKINNSHVFVVSIDVPSGMFMDRPSPLAVSADVVLTFQSTKLAFYLPGNYGFIKKVVILDIGLDKDYIENTPTDYYFTNREAALQRYRPVPYYAHKGTQGHALIIGGSYGKIGAVTLAAKAALKSGCGLVTALLPECGYNVIQAALPEVMALTSGLRHIDEISFDLKTDATGIGPGMGMDPQTQQAFHDFLKRRSLPLVIDADALNILSLNKDWLGLLPQNSILTPHPKELERLMGVWQDDFDKLEMLKAFSQKYRVIIVAKDARTFIIDGDTVHINATGNAALATGGSGDVLAGIITGLLAQGYNSASAAVTGVYIHGLTADIAVGETGMQAFTASTITKYLGRSFLEMDTGKGQ